MKTKVSFLLSLVMLVAVLAGCGKRNINHIPSNYSCPEEYIFDDAYSEAWNAAKDAVSAQNVIKFMDRESGIITTEPKTVDGNELSLQDILFLGKTYKYTYTVNLSSLSEEKTLIRIDVKLFEKIAVLLEREKNIAYVNSYLRAKLYRNICGRLSSTNNSVCDEQFARYHVNNFGNERFSSEESNSKSFSNNKKSPDQQTMSVQKGLLNKGYDPGPVDGFMGNKTRTAIKKYQRDNDMYADGRVSKELLVSLGLLDGHDSQGMQERQSAMTSSSISYREPKRAVENKHNNISGGQNTFQTGPNEISKQDLPDPSPTEEKTPALEEHDKQAYQDLKDISVGAASPMEEESPRVNSPNKIVRGTVTEKSELKAEPDPFSESLILVPREATVEVIDKTSFWLKVKYQTQIGYVMADVVKTQ